MTNFKSETINFENNFETLRFYQFYKQSKLKFNYNRHDQIIEPGGFLHFESLYFCNGELALYFQILSFNFFIGFVGLCSGFGKAGVAKLRQAQRINSLLQQR